MVSLDDKGKREFTKSDLDAIIDGAIDLVVSHGILNPCVVKVERDGQTFLELGYKIADDYTLEQLQRMAYGAEEIKSADSH